MGSTVDIDGKRLWDSLMEMAKIGAIDEGGVCRLALTDFDKAARDRLLDAMLERAGVVS